MTKNILSKSTFIRGLQCHKSLYLYKHRSFLRDKLSPEQQAKFKRGTDMGVLARQLFPGGVNLAPPTPFQYARSVAQTQEHIALGTQIIYEAAFRNNGVLVALDILENRDGLRIGYEVKSSVSISETFLWDAALQFHVIRQSGLHLADIFIIFVNPDYRLHGEPDLSQLFIKRSVLQEVVERQSFVEKEIEAQLKIVERTSSPGIDIGSHCNKPYPCDFQGHCWKHIPKNSIFELHWLTEAQKFELYANDVMQVENIPDNFLSDPQQQLRLTAHKTQNRYFDRVAVRNYTKEMSHPTCLLKIWYYRSALPIFEGTRPYEKLPLIAVTGILQGTNLEIQYYRFGSKTNFLPGLQQMLADISGQCRSIITFDDPNINQYFENQTAADSDSQHPPVFDLHDVFSSAMIYEPLTKGDTQLHTLVSALMGSQKKETAAYFKTKLTDIAMNIQSKEQLDNALNGNLEPAARAYMERMKELLEYLSQVGH